MCIQFSVLSFFFCWASTLNMHPPSISSENLTALPDCILPWSVSLPSADRPSICCSYWSFTLWHISCEHAHIWVCVFNFTCYLNKHEFHTCTSVQLWCGNLKPVGHIHRSWTFQYTSFFMSKTHIILDKNVIQSILFLCIMFWCDTILPFLEKLFVMNLKEC